MSIQTELVGAVESALNDAVQAAQANWQRTPALTKTAMLTGSSVDTCSDAASGEIIFETHRQFVPRSVRDIYGVATKTAAVPVAGRGAASTKTLMQETSEIMEDAFLKAMDVHLS